jgi:hypothetical protein
MDSVLQWNASYVYIWAAFSVTLLVLGLQVLMAISQWRRQIRVVTHGIYTQSISNCNDASSKGRV